VHVEEGEGCVGGGYEGVGGCGFGCEGVGGEETAVGDGGLVGFGGGYVSVLSRSVVRVS